MIFLFEQTELPIFKLKTLNYPAISIYKPEITWKPELKRNRIRPIFEILAGFKLCYRNKAKPK